MEFKKKLKTRLYIAIIYISLGIMMITGTFAIKTDNDFIDEDKTLAINDNKELSDLSGYLDLIKNTVIKSQLEQSMMLKL